MGRMHGILATTLAYATVAFAVPAHADGNNIGRGGAGNPTHLGTFRGAEAASRALLMLLHTRLAITASQESVWKPFADAVIHEAADADAQLAHPPSASNAADALTQRAAALEQQANDAIAVAQAFSALYAALTPAQRKLVDDYFAHGGLM